MSQPLLAVLGCVAVVAPASDPARDATHAPRIELTLAGAGVVRATLRRALPEFLDELGVGIEWREVTSIELDAVLDPPPVPTLASARIFVDASREDRVQLFIVDAAWERVLVRKVALVGGLDEVARDEIGWILQSSLEALLAGGEIGVSRERAAAQLGARPSVPEPAAAPGFAFVSELALGYGARAWGSLAPLHGPALAWTAAAERDRTTLGGVLEGQWIAPVVVHGEGLRLRLSGLSARVLGHLGVSVGERVALELRLGGGLDVLRDRTRAEDPAAQAFAGRTRVVGNLALRSGPSWRLRRGRDRVVLRVHATADAAIGAYRYVTAEGAPIVDPWVVRPGVSLSLGWWRASVGAARPRQRRHTNIATPTAINTSATLKVGQLPPHG